MAMLSELGLDPISIDALKLAIGCWYHVINTTNESLVHKAYEENLTLQNGTASKIKQLFWKIGFNHVWENQSSFSKKRLLVSVVKKLRERFINFWKSNLFDDRNSANGNKLRTCREFKTEYTLEFFLLLDLDLDISNFVKVRISNSRLFIEQGRYK